jgi:UDP-glucuronate 4-epimerase
LQPSLFSGRNVLVTGAAGFIGSHVVNKLTLLGYPVVGIDNLNDYYDPALKEARLRHLCNSPLFTFCQADIADRSAIRGLFRKHAFGVVIHLAAQAGVRYSLTNPYAYIDSNVTGFLNILEGARHHQCDHLVFASSSSVYGANVSVPFRECDATDQPVSLYAATKKSNEGFAHAYSHLFGIPMTGLRFFTVYGPWGRPDMAIFKFVHAITTGQPITLFNNGAMCRDFTYVDDVVESILRVAEHPPSRSEASETLSEAKIRILNIGNECPVELLHLVRVIERALGDTARIEFAPMAQGDVYKTFAATDELERLTGYSPQWRVEDGIAQFVNWYRDYYGVRESVPVQAEGIGAPFKPAFGLSGTL